MNSTKKSKNSGIWSECLEYGACTDVGLRRTNNQDNYAVVIAANQEQWNKRGHLFLVADGMGAHAAGDLASKIASINVPLVYNKQMDQNPPTALRNAIVEANDVIHRRGNSSDDFRGMGTTCCTVLFLPDGALIGHVGDSRVYRVRGDVINQMTFDHSLVWEMKALAQSQGQSYSGELPKNIITRCLGVHPEVEPDIEGPFPLVPGDTYLLCSDGLSGLVDDNEIGKILYTLPPDQAVLVLKDMAILRGGPDNITVVVGKYLGSQQAQGSSPSDVASFASVPKGPFSPLLLSLSAVSLLVAVLLIPLALNSMAAAIGLLVFLLASIIIALVAIIQRNNKSERMNLSPSGRRGPYTQSSAMPDAGFCSTLMQLIADVRPKADEVIHQDSSKESTELWNSYLALEKKANDEEKDKKYPEAVRDYARGLHFLMDHLS